MSFAIEANRLLGHCFRRGRAAFQLTRLNFSRSRESIYARLSTNKKSTNSRSSAAFIFVARISERALLIHNADSRRSWLFFMSERQQSPYDSIARRWLVLIERRQQHFVQLCHSGRWRRYYTHAQFFEEMGKVLQLRNQWAQLAGLPPSEQIEAQQIDLQLADLKQIKLQPDIKQSDRQRQPPGVQYVNPVSPGAAEPRRRPASAILAAVAGRL
jgi:hypothetical protein